MPVRGGVTVRKDTLALPVDNGPQEGEGARHGQDANAATCLLPNLATDLPPIPVSNRYESERPESLAGDRIRTRVKSALMRPAAPDPQQRHATGRVGKDLRTGRLRSTVFRAGTG